MASKIPRTSTEEAAADFRAVFENAAIGIARVGPDGRPLNVNRALQEMLGYTEAELRTMPFGMFTHPEDVDTDAVLHSELLAGARRSYRIDKRYFRKDGSVLWGHLVVSLVHDDDGEPLYTINMVEDITQRKHQEESLRDYAEELERSNKELEQFAYVTSHDLQEPLRMVTSFTQLLSRRYADTLDEKGREYIRYARDGAVRMQDLLRDLLSYSRLNTHGLQHQATELGEVLERVRGLLLRAFQESKAVLTHDPLPAVAGDATQLTQLFQNLIGNAIKFRSEARPEIHIGVTAVTEDDQDFWQFAVQDNGIGIDAEYFERIFVIFQRLNQREAYPGTGIGLALCKRIVERHSGRIWVESTPGNGTTFYFTLLKAPAA